ncbi:TldD/PmbA family protein [Microbulbifer thermotolerans]|uniref:TldD/PmbA family protein n=1 Tax=Microbulbifer thermotolerans TaxID=252514 RepID=A0AB35HY59_MICTH|nr:TldD/PmbA family protein [Microbulbifer thermotolerans]MCX2779141.1 TldD/PmbA family protein [Microbulbifer thermotolerans]MCX2795673.1 TldD/PmbA family protein [Microbulbifer thermotolerans]MCX2802482.1 TldD/PmbA family protein [Microbulbifer thermotolerans]MCX2806422.1 TldD/PmbA family protein [Microbulbifer thermotolerans]MCX2830324.1 TldD/PmbA family protein [Microbulbifer thermotolerans]
MDTRIDRRRFLKIAGVGASGILLPVYGTPVTAAQLTNEGMDARSKKALADVVLNTARKAGASYTDVRIGRYLNQFVITRETRVENIVNTESFGAGIRVIADGTWGFAATNDLTPDGIAKAARQAVAVARANAKYQKEPVQLAPVKGVGEVSWQTPIEKNAFEVPISEKVDFLMEVNNAAMVAGADFINSTLYLVNEQKYFASSDGSYIDQDVHRLWAPMTVTAVDKKSGTFKTRNGFSDPVGRGYEYLDGREADKIHGQTVLYRNSYDMIEDARLAAQQARAKHGAKSIKPGQYDLVLDPSHLMLTIHESVGHPLELDRVLGYEANYAGTSFATLDKWRSGKFQYGSDKVNIFADKTQPGSLGAVGYDDEGVKTKRWDLIKNGILVNYQAIRDQVHMLDQKESHGCCYADSWSSVQFQRMPNVSLAPGEKKYSPKDMIRDVEKGIYIIGRGSYSIDQQRYNFQFGGQLFYEIKNGEIVGQVEDVAYQSNTQEFWNACSAICDSSDYRLGGTFFDGKGQPSQVSAVSHGCSTARFDKVNVINTKRRIS